MKKRPPSKKAYSRTASWQLGQKVGLVTAIASLIERFAGNENGVGILLQCRFVSTLRSLYQRLDVSPKSALPIFFQAPRGSESDFRLRPEFRLRFERRSIPAWTRMPRHVRYERARQRELSRQLTLRGSFVDLAARSSASVQLMKKYVRWHLRSHGEIGVPRTSVL